MWKILFLFGVIGACDRPTELPISEGTEATTSESTTVQKTEGKAGSEVDRRRIEKEVCKDQNPCTLTDLKEADSQGIFVAEVAFLENPQGDWKSPNPDDEEDGCNSWALYRVNIDLHAMTHTKLAEFCNDGYGASGIGEDVWEVQDGELSISSYGGSNWRWTRGAALDLKTLTVVKRSDSQHLSTDPDLTEFSSWSFYQLSGRVEWTSTCGEELKKYEFLAIPSLELPEAFVNEGWKRTSIADCSTALDESRGFVIHGRADDLDVHMHVVASADREIFVEVLDPKIVASGTGNWIHGDHLEVWMSPESLPKMKLECDEKPKSTTWQWGVDAVHGTVHAAHGKPKHQLIAESVKMEGGARFRIKSPPEAATFAIVYSKSEDGKTQKQLISTSPLKFGEAPTLGEMVKLRTQDVSCELQDGKLLKRLPTLTRALSTHD